MSTFVFDCETLPNYTLVSAKNVDSGEVFDFERQREGAPGALRGFLEQEDAVFIGFNNQSFDDVIVAAFCAGRSEAEIKRLADDLIVSRTPAWKALRKFMLSPVRMDSVDLIEVAPSFVGLKAYGARMHMPRLQDMPMAHDQPITVEQRGEVIEYCHNDLDTTQELLRQLDSELTLRVDMSRRYGVDMRSRSDSQMAEAAYIKTLGLKRRENTIPKTVRYAPPSFLRFADPTLEALLKKVTEHVFDVSPNTGHVRLPDFLGKEVVRFGSGTYQLGVGGIHSTHDRKVCHIAGEDVICDIDAASFYPSIILECGFGPKDLGQAFVDEYRRIYTERFEAKRRGDKATDATLKISLNGTFGKLASRWSPLYSPDLMLAVTLTGQFTLLMLIEWLEYAGVEILSANTDGIAVKYPPEHQEGVEHVVRRFSEVSRFSFEYTPYRALAMKDVNNYIAVKTDRQTKMKGIYTPCIERYNGKDKPTLKKNPTAQVCADAVAEWLANGTPIEQTIRAARFVDFLSARNVTGGGEQGGEYLGKVVRWYQSNLPGLQPIQYCTNGNLVAKTDGGRACMVIDPARGHPEDLNYEWYLTEACRIAVAVGCEQYLTEAERQRVAPVKPKRKAKNGN
jgi:hypothetical protein